MPACDWSLGCCFLLRRSQKNIVMRGLRRSSARLARLNSACCTLRPDVFRSIDLNVLGVYRPHARHIGSTSSNRNNSDDGPEPTYATSGKLTGYKVAPAFCSLQYRKFGHSKYVFTTSLSFMWYTGISSQQTIPVARGRNTLRIRAGIRNVGHPQTPQRQRNFVTVWHVSILARSEHGREPFTRMVGKVHWAWTPSGMPVHARKGSLMHLSTTSFVSGVNYHQSTT
jgi:hypothetical protein